MPSPCRSCGVPPPVDGRPGVRPPGEGGAYDALAARAGEISEMCQAETVLGTLTEVEHVAGCRLREIDLGSGMVACELQFPESLYYDILSGKTGFDITGRVSSWSCSRSWPR